LLRGDNADLRLTPIGHRLGLVASARAVEVEGKRAAIRGELDRLGQVSLKPSMELDAYLARLGMQPLDSAIRAAQFLRRPGAAYDVVAEFVPSPVPLPDEVIEQVELELKYEGYIEKQRRQVARAQRLETRHIPDGFDYEGVVGLRTEAREQLLWRRPQTVGQASRIQGVSPADISILLVHLQRHQGTSVVDQSLAP
jgi:tRNA uridine 5-carboxymethylaminomethyl modification enzyme